jgi:hypothetical protein
MAATTTLIGLAFDLRPAIGARLPAGIRYRPPVTDILPIFDRIPKRNRTVQPADG